MDIINKIKQDRFWLILVASSVALITAYVAEIFFNLQPCTLCIYQRIIYFILLLSSILTIYFPISRKKLTSTIILALIGEIITSSYHIGVEHHWIEESSVCQVSNNAVNFLSASKISSNCSEVYFRFMNLSMVEWNLLYTLILLYCFLRKNNNKEVTSFASS